VEAAVQMNLEIAWSKKVFIWSATTERKY
jgi:hypothetical protein